jgi:hypothetical protein
MGIYHRHARYACKSRMLNALNRQSSVRAIIVHIWTSLGGNASITYYKKEDEKEEIK